jgi:hypothetical protein
MGFPLRIIDADDERTGERFSNVSRSNQISYAIIGHLRGNGVCDQKSCVPISGCCYASGVRRAKAEKGDQLSCIFAKPDLQPSDPSMVARTKMKTGPAYCVKYVITLSRLAPLRRAAQAMSFHKETAARVCLDELLTAIFRGPTN